MPSNKAARRQLLTVAGVFVAVVLGLYFIIEVSFVRGVVGGGGASQSLDSGAPPSLTPSRSGDADVGLARQASLDDPGSRLPIAIPSQVQAELQFVSPSGEKILGAIPFALFECGSGCLGDLAGPGGAAVSPAYEGETNPNGYAIVSGLTEGVYDLSTSDFHYVVGDARFTPKTDEVHQVVLREGCSLSGRVVDRRGMPITDARVCAELGQFMRESDAAPSVFSRSNYRFTTTDERGMYQISGVVPQAQMRIAAMSEGYATNATERFLIDGLYSAAPELVLNAESTVVVRLHNPAAFVTSGSQLRLSPKREYLLHVERRLECKGQGPYVFEGLPSGDYRLYLESERVVAPDIEFHLGQSQAVSQTMYLEGRNPLVGVVVNAENQAVTGARVVLEGGKRREHVRTGQEGEFRIGNFVAEERELVVRAAGFLPYREHITVNTTLQGDEFRVILNTGLSASFQANYSGKLVPDFQLEMQHTPLGAKHPELFVHRHRSTDGMVTASGFTEGRLSGMIRASTGDGDDTHLVGFFETEVFEAKPTNAVTVLMTQMVNVKGIVVDSDSNPIEGAQVHAALEAQGNNLTAGLLLQGAFGKGIAGYTDANGEFYLEDLHPAKSSIGVKMEGYEERRIDLSEMGVGYCVIELTSMPHENTR